MEPNEQPQYSIDYLDSIATTPRNANKGPSDKVFFGAIIGGLIIALLVGAFIFLSSGPSTSDDMARLSAKLQSLQSIADASKKNIVSSKLRGVNTNLSLTLTNTNRDAAAQLAANGLVAGELDPRIVAAENTGAIFGRLENARLNAVFDRTYAREMSHQLEMLILLTEHIEAKTNSASLKKFLETTQNNMEPLRRQFAEFNAATS